MNTFHHLHPHQWWATIIPAQIATSTSKWSPCFHPSPLQKPDDPLKIYVGLVLPFLLPWVYCLFPLLDSTPWWWGILSVSLLYPQGRQQWWQVDERHPKFVEWKTELINKLLTFFVNTVFFFCRESSLKSWHDLGFILQKRQLALFHINE